jgi:hypothetical protein
LLFGRNREQRVAVSIRAPCLNFDKNEIVLMPCNYVDFAGAPEMEIAFNDLKALS